MKVIKVTYTVQAGFAAQNQANINRFLGELQHRRDIYYSVYLCADGKTFHHVAVYEDDAAQKILLELAAFKAFQQQRDASGLEVAPQIEALQWVGSTYPLSQ